MMRKHSDELIAAVIAACKSGEKQIVVAMTYGMPERTVRYWRKKAGLIKPRGAPPKFDHAGALRVWNGGGKTKAAIAREYGVTPGAIYVLCKRARDAGKLSA